jgi:methyl-accepting chemotaxis protein
LGAARGTAGRRRLAGEHGFVNIVVLGVVVLAVGTAAVLLGRTVTAAQRINEKAGRIAKTGRGINIATDAVIQLNRTNDTAGSILNTAQPLEGKLDKIVTLAQSIDKLGGSINTTAGKINSTAKTIGGSAVDIGGTAGDINSTAKGINSVVAEILDVARRIDTDVRLINENLEATLALARGIKGDTGNILKQANAAHQNAACIDQKVGSTGRDQHCQ